MRTVQMTGEPESYEAGNLDWSGNTQSNGPESNLLISDSANCFMNEPDTWAPYPQSPPDDQTWSTLSTCSGDIASDTPNLSPASELGSIDWDLAAMTDMSFKAEASPARASVRQSRTSRQSYRFSPYSVQHPRTTMPLMTSQYIPERRFSTPMTYIDQNFVNAEQDFSLAIPSEEMSMGLIQTNGCGDNCQNNFPIHVRHTIDDISSFYPSDMSQFVSQQRGPHMLHDDSCTEDHFEDQFAGAAKPPDLYGRLQEDHSMPPPEDMNPEDPDMMPREQELRFEGDMYTPKYVRGHGNKREGWCGICKPGRWLVLKNSAFWYDKSFSHGVSAATGKAFDGPSETRPMSGNPDVWEGFCNSCGDWIALISSKKKGTTWFRHAYKVSQVLQSTRIMLLIHS